MRRPRNNPRIRLSTAAVRCRRTFTYHADGQLASASCDGIGRAGAHASSDIASQCSLRLGDMRTPQTETFLWDGLALIQRGDEQFINEPHVGGGNPVASSKGTSYFNDALGTTVGSKSNGKYSAAALTAFGENHLTTEPPNHQTFFTGKPYVEGLGHAFWMRNYRAGLAKWQTADPMGYPDGWNALAYCNNGVTSAVDLWGCDTVQVGEVLFDMRKILPDAFKDKEELHLDDVWLECNHNYEKPYADLVIDRKIGIEEFYNSSYEKDGVEYTFFYELTKDSKVIGYPQISHDEKAVDYQWAVQITITAKKKSSTPGGGVVTDTSTDIWTSELQKGRHIIRKPE